MHMRIRTYKQTFIQYRVLITCDLDNIGEIVQVGNRAGYGRPGRPELAPTFQG
jgi:hypothetical protein